MILLSFDTEEFDVPREHGVDYPLDEAMKVSVYGTNRILDCLLRNDVKATFFCTTNFAENAPEVMKRIIDEGHEIAAHGCDHWNPKPEDGHGGLLCAESPHPTPMRGALGTGTAAGTAPRRIAPGWGRRSGRTPPPAGTARRRRPPSWRPGSAFACFCVSCGTSHVLFRERPRRAERTPCGAWTGRVPVAREYTTYR